MAAGRMTIRLLGPFDVQIGDKPLPPLRTRKGEHLLALLALRLPREVQREWLASNIWPDSDFENASYNFRRALSNLRSALGPARDCLLAPTPHSLCLATDGRVEVDVVRFDSLVRKGDVTSLEAAVDLYRGALLEGFEAEWIDAEREFRHQACLKALDTLASQAIGCEDWSEAVRWLKRMTALEPFGEEAQRRLIETLAQKGDYAAAAMAYREYRERLRTEMNATPAPETTALFRKIQIQGSQSVATAKVTTLPKEQEEFTGSLPRPLTSFIGRNREMEEIQRLLSSSRLVTLLGPGGIGKTRLAIQVAERKAEEFPDGVWFVDLAPLSDPALLWQSLARTLKLREEPEHPLLETLLTHLSSKQLLLILDNCEHLQEACAEFAERLLSDCPSISLLATSRQTLGIRIEAVWQVPPLTLPLKRKLPPAGEGLAFVLPQYEAARLFAERAAEAMPAFILTEQNASATLRIVSRLDGLPLAIELAAARVRALSVEQVAARLDNRFRLLTRGAVGAQPRQQTLRATIDWSYDLLSDAEAALLRRLSVFAGGWTLEAAEEICGVPAFNFGDLANPNPEARIESEEVLDLLTDLIEKSLVVADQDVGGERRYRMLESIREYAFERLQESGREEWQRARHAEWYFRLAGEAREHLYGPDQAFWLDRLEADHDNLRAVLEWGLGETNEARQKSGVMISAEAVPGAETPFVSPLETGVRMASQLYEYWKRRGYIREGRRWLFAAVDQSRETLPLGVRAVALLNAGNMLGYETENLEEQKALYQESLTLSRQLDDPQQIAGTLSNLGIVAHFQKDYPQASAYYEEAIPILRELVRQMPPSLATNNLRSNRKMPLAVALLNYGALLHEMGDYERSLPLHEESLALRREIGNRIGVASTLDGMAYVHKDLGDLAAAQACFIESMQIRQEVGDRFGLMRGLELAAELGVAQERWSAAVRYYGAAARAQKDQDWSESPSDSRDGYLQKAKEMLGESRFDSEWAAGEALSLEEAVEECLQMPKNR